MNNELKKPKVKLVGQDGNVFNLMGICSRELKKVGQVEQSKEMCSRIMSCGSYSKSLSIMMEYCDVN